MGDLISLSCPSCGGKLEVSKSASVLTCKHCGSEHLVRRDSGAVTLEAFARCPKCGRNDRVEKVTSIMRSHADDTKLVQSLAKPSKPSLLPKPELSPKPILQEEPHLLEKPESIPRPTIEPKIKYKYRKPNVPLIIIGGVFIIAGYFFGVLALPIYWEEINFSSILFYLVLSLVPTGFGIVIAASGFLSKKEISLTKSQIEKIISNHPSHSQKIIHLTIASILIIISVSCVLILLLFGEQPEPFDVRVHLIFLIPAILGSLLILKVFIDKRIANYNRLRLNDFELEINEREQRKANIEYQWEQENKLILQKWEDKNDQIFKKWQDDNTLALKDWEISNAPILQEWEKGNATILNKWHQATDRWQNLYFCYRDDIVFIPGETTYATAEKMEDYLFNN